MPYNRDNEYYVAIKDTRDENGELINPNGNIITFDQNILDSLNDDSTFKIFVNDYIISEQEDTCSSVGEKYEVKGNWVGCALAEDWKHNLVDDWVGTMRADVIEKYIAEIGLIKCCKFVDDCGMYESENILQELTTVEGLRKFFYCVMYEIMEIAKGVIAIEQDEFEHVYGFRYSTINEYYDMMMTTDDTDDTDDEEEIEYGGIVASAA